MVVAIGGLVALTTGAIPIVALAVVALLAAVIVAARPDAAALLAVAILYSNAAVVAINQHGVPGAGAFVVPLLLLVTISYRVFARREPLLLPRAALWVVALLVIQIIGAMASREPIVATEGVKTFILEGLLLFVLLTNALRGYEMIRLAAIVVVVAAGVLGSLALVKGAIGGGEVGGFATTSKAVVNKDEGGGEKRHAGPIGEQNRWAQTLAVVLPVAVALGFADRSRTTRLLARAGIVGIAVGIVTTYSRGAVVGLALTGLVAVALRWVSARKAVAVAVVAAIGLAIVAPVFAGRASTVVSARSSIDGSAGEEGGDGSFANRATEATAALAVFFRHPVVGVGPGLFPTYFQDEARRLGADRIVGVNRESHNLYLGLAAEMGLTGLIAFGGVVGSIFGPVVAVRTRHLRRRPDVAGLATGMALALVTYLTTGLFLHFGYIRYFWLLAALAAAMGMVHVEDEEPTALAARTGAPQRTGEI
jgi:O-antigen ligase